MKTVGIIANGPKELLPNISTYKPKVDVWIAADRGALILMENQITIDYALGDFDSLNSHDRGKIRQESRTFKKYSSEKDKTDLEIALLKAFELKPSIIYLFGVTGGRMDHTLVNIQLLTLIVEKGITGIIIDKYNKLELTMPGKHMVTNEDYYPNISFIPLTPYVKGLTLLDFYYPLTGENITMGSTRCISNKLLSNSGTFSYEEGILLLIKSRD